MVLFSTLMSYLMGVSI